MRNIFILLFLFPSMLMAQTTYDVLLTNGKVIDGTGNGWYYADIAVKDGRIALIKNTYGR